MPRQSLKDAVNEWLESFSLSQLKNIPRTKNIYWQLFWFLTFLITLGCGLWKSYGEVQKYLDYPFDTYKRFEPSLSTPFPAVTICNLNPMSQENGNYIRQVKELMTVYRYHLSLIAEKEAKNAAGFEKIDKSRNKRSADVAALWIVPPGSDLRKCEMTSTTFETTSSTTMTSATTTELPSTTTKTTTEQSTIAPSTTTAQTTTTSEIPVSTTTVHQTTPNAPTSTEDTVLTSKKTEVTLPETTVRPKPTTTNVPTTEVPSSVPLSTAPQKTKPSTTVTQESETEIPASETTEAQTEELSTVHSTVKYTESTSENPKSAVTTTSKSKRTTGKSTKSSTSTEYSTTEAYTSEIPSIATSSTPPSTVKYLVTEEKETTASTTTNTDTSNDQTSKAADVEFATSKPSTVEVQTTKPSTIEVVTSKPSTVEVQKTTFQSNEFSTTKPKNVEIPTTEQPTVKPTKKSTTADVRTPKTESTESASQESSTVQPTTKSVNNEMVTDDPESFASTTTNPEDSNDRFTKSTAVKYTTTRPIQFKTTGSQSTTLNQNEIKIQTTTFTPHIPSQKQTTEYVSAPFEPSDNSATSTTKTMTNKQESTSLPATPLTSESTKFTTKSTTVSPSTTIYVDSEKRTTKSETDKYETTKVEETMPSSISTPVPQTTKFTPQKTTQEKDEKYSSSNRGTSDSSTTTTVTNQLPGQTTTSSTTASSGNSATASTIQTSTFSATSATMKSTNTASKSTVFSSAASSTESSTQEPSATTINFGETSTTTVSTNSVQNEDSETQKSSKSTTANDKTTSETNNQHSSPSTSPSPNAQLTTADPVIFEGLTKSELNELTDKFQIVPDSSRISLESQAQGRLLSMANSNLSSGYAVNDIIISCTYNMISCDLEKDFSKMTDPWFGNCYTFNYNAKHLIVGAGNKFGLKIVAFSNVTEYLPTSSAAGMKVVVHKQNFDPFPNNEGIYAGVGSHIDVNVRYKSLEQLTAPYGVCRHENDTAGYIYDGRYRIEGCYRSCFQQRIIDECQCADPRFPKPRGSNITFCDVSNVTGFTCYVRYLSTKGDFMHVKNCVCPHGCTEPDYTLDVWPSKWPIKKNNFTTPKCWGNYSKTKIDCLKAYKENAVAIDVTHKYMFYRRTYEQASFSVMDLILEIAGNLGLWTGFSMLVLGEIFHIFFFLFSRPNVDARVEDIEMSDISNQNTADIYDSQNIADEYGNDVPRPIISHDSNAGGLMQDVPSANDNVSSESESEEECFDLKESDSCAAFLVKPELLYDISKEFGDDATDDNASEIQPKSLQGSKLVDRMYLELKKAGKIQPMCPVNFKKYHFAVPSNYKRDISSTSHDSDSGITQNLSSYNYTESEIEDHKDPDVHHGKSIQPMLLRDLSPEIENLEMTGLPQSRCPFPPIKGFVRTLADVPDDYRPYISNGRLCFSNTRKYYFPNETQNDATRSTSTKNASLSNDETQSPSSSTKIHEKQSYNIL